jgi:hypothetical protein
MRTRVADNGCTDVIASASNDQSDSRPSRWKNWRRWSILLLFAVLEGAAAGAARDGIAGAIKGGLFGAFIGPPLLAIASIVGHNQRHFLWALLLAAVAEAAGVLILGGMAGFVAGMPAWLLAAQVILPFAGVVTVGRVISRERRWTIRGAVSGGVLGALSGIALGIYAGIVEGDPPLVIGIIAGACGFGFALLGACTCAFLFSCVATTWRSRHRRKIALECRRARRCRQVVDDSTDYLNLGDLDRIAAAPPHFRDFCLLLLTSASDCARMLRFESLGNISRVWLTRRDAAEELAPLPVPTEMLVRYVLGDVVDRPAFPQKPDSRRLQTKIGESVVTGVVFSDGAEHNRSLVFQFQVSEQVAEVASAVLRNYRRFFVGDPWSPEHPVRLPVRRSTDADDARSTARAHDLLKGGNAFLRLTFRSQFILGEGPPLWASVDGIWVASGSWRKGFDEVLPISTGNHLLQIAAGPAQAAAELPPWFRAREGWAAASSQLLLSIPEPGVYRIKLCSAHFGAGQHGGYVPVVKQVGLEEVESYLSKTQ